MSLDSSALATVKAAAQQMEAAEALVERSRRRHRDAVRALHAGGASLREIAAALKLSHQRVHQLVTSPRQLAEEASASQHPPVPELDRAPETKRSSRGAALASRPCRLCGEAEAGEICVRCREAGGGLIGNEPVGDWRGLRLVYRHNRRACGFCNRLPQAGERFVGGSAAVVCAECLSRSPDEAERDPRA